MKKIIGIDIDGVITDEIHPNKNVWHNALCEFLGREIERVKDSYYFDEAYNLSSDTINAFLKKNHANIYREAKLAKGAKETINYLYKNGFHIHLITAREPEFEEITREWIIKQGIEYTSLIHEVDKAPLAVKKGIELFIEDNAFNSLELSKKNIYVLLINKYHNLNMQNTDKITRVDYWSEIKEEIFNYYSLN